MPTSMSNNALSAIMPMMELLGVSWMVFHLHASTAVWRMGKPKLLTERQQVIGSSIAWERCVDREGIGASSDGWKEGTVAAAWRDEAKQLILGERGSEKGELKTNVCLAQPAAILLKNPVNSGPIPHSIPFPSTPGTAILIFHVDRGDGIIFSSTSSFIYSSVTLKVPNIGQGSVLWAWNSGPGSPVANRGGISSDKDSRRLWKATNEKKLAVKAKEKVWEHGEVHSDGADPIGWRWTLDTEVPSSHYILTPKFEGRVGT